MNRYVTGLVFFLGMLVISATSGFATEAVLSSGSGDGTAMFGVDEFGSIRGCGGTGIVFDPIGPYAAKNANCSMILFAFDANGTARQAISNNDWPYYGLSCCGGDPATHPLADQTHVLSDQLVSTHTRISTFVLPAFPQLKVHLRQTACGGKLTQTYTFTNQSVAPLSLRLSRTGDIDVEYSAGFTSNSGVFVPPNGVEVLDNAGDAGIRITASGAQFTLEGWRIFQKGGGGAAALAQVWQGQGFPPSALNGYFLANPGAGICNPSWCTINETQQPQSGTLDTAAAIQGILTIGANQSSVYTTETIGNPGMDTCPLCGDPPGDVNGDGVVNVTDTQCVIQAGLWAYGGYVTGEPTCLAANPLGADLNCNGTFNVTDVQLAVLYVLNSPLPKSVDFDGNYCVDACE